MNNKEIEAIVEHYIYCYNSIDNEISDLQNGVSIPKRDANSWIKSKGKINRGVEIEAIKNISIEEKVKRYLIWKKIIYNVITDCQKNESDKYLFIKLRYFQKRTLSDIEEIMAIHKNTLNKIRMEFVYLIALYAVKEKLIIL